jgi:arylsulfatase A-like enzyme
MSRWRALGDPLIAHAAGGVLLGAVEAVQLGSASLAWPLLAIFAATGIAAGLLVAGAELLARRAGTGRALIRALPALAVAVPVGRTLFDGAYAATLPLASSMPLILPLAVWIGVALAIAGGDRLIARGRRAIVAALLAAGAVALWWINRVVFRSGYLDAHAGVTIAEVVLAGAAIRVVARGPAGRIAQVATVVAVAVAAVVACAAGLAAPGDRRALAVHGDDGRHLVRVWSMLADLDGDGVASVLGGGDCVESDPRVHPGAADVAGNGIDEDCDGRDAVPAPPAPPAPSASTLAEWRALPAVRAQLDRSRAMNVLVISIDALRADVLAEGAPGRDDFPRLTALLAGARWFTRAVAPAAGTDLCLGTLVTGRWDPYQGVATTLHEAARASGRRTTAIVPREVLRYAGETLIARGIDDLVPVVSDPDQRDVGSHETAAATTDRALDVIDAAAAGAAPFWVWAHYFDVHEHAQIPLGARALARVGTTGGSARAHRYRALLAGVDREIGRLLDGLERAGRVEDTLILFYSDHGESLGEDPRLPEQHGTVVYQALTHVPIAIVVPGVAPARVAHPVGLVDVAPTLLALLGAGDAMGTLDGRDLTPLLLDAPAALHPPMARPFVMHESAQWAVLEWPWKVLVRPAEDLVELYDLSTDPGERIDRAAAEPAITAALRARYAEFPAVHLDRTRAGRQWREARSRPPPSPGRP